MCHGSTDLLRCRALGVHYSDIVIVIFTEMFIVIYWFSLFICTLSTAFYVSAQSHVHVWAVPRSDEHALVQNAEGQQEKLEESLQGKRNGWMFFSIVMTTDVRGHHCSFTQMGLVLHINLGYYQHTIWIYIGIVFLICESCSSKTKKTFPFHQSLLEPNLFSLILL